MASAKLGAPRETALGLDRNHSEICKFLGKDDHAYQGVEPNLRAMAESSRAHNVQCDHRAAISKRPGMKTQLRNLVSQWSIY